MQIEDEYGASQVFDIICELNEALYNYKQKKEIVDDSWIDLTLSLHNYSYVVKLGNEPIFFSEDDIEYDEETGEDIPLGITIKKKMQEYVDRIKIWESVLKEDNI